MKNNNKNRKLLKIQIKNEFNKLKCELLSKYDGQELSEDMKEAIALKSKEFIRSSKVIQRFFMNCSKIKSKRKLLEQRNIILVQVNNIKKLK